MTEPYKEILRDVESRKFQEKAIEYLSELGFAFMNYTTIKELIPHFPSRFWKWQFMVRIAKRGISDKYDFNLLFGFKIMGKHVDRLYAFKLPIMWVNRDVLDYNAQGKVIGASIVANTTKKEIIRPVKFKKIEMAWKEGKIINFKKKKTLTKFPDELSIQERIDWRKLNERILNPKSRLPVEGNDLAWYLKWKAKILKLNPHLEPY